jgi:hypothetical protein
MYPHRVFTAGRKLATGRSLDIALATMAADASFVQANEAGPTASMRPRSQAPSTRSRHGCHTARCSPSCCLEAGGVICPWPAFAPHYQDHDPSADPCGIYNQKFIDMLL